jgi:hypothetical protein
MQPRVRNLIIILFILLLILSGAIWWYFNSQKQNIPTTQIPVTTSTPSSQQVAIDTQVQENLTEQIAGKSEEQVSDYAAILNVSRFFVERYGSFSNGAMWQNIYDIKSVVTDVVWSDLEKLTQSNTAANTDLSLSTKALSLELLSQNESSATVLVKTQKKETAGEFSRVYYQDITLDLQKLDVTWLVADFELGPEKK